MATDLCGFRKNIFYLLLGCVMSAAGCALLTENCDSGKAASFTYETSDSGYNIQLYAESAILMDGETGEIIYAKNAEQHRANASTTKILTCILALECGNLEDYAEVSSYAARMPEVRLGVREGERYRLKDLLYAMMLESYNDAAVVIAEHIGGSVEKFAGMMNAKAEEIGCLDTYFITPNGLDDKDDTGIHGTTAADLAKIMRYCVDVSPLREEFLDITETRSHSFSDDTGRRIFSCINHNAFLDMSGDAISGKTGFTCDAGYCYVGAAKKDGHTYIWSLLGCGWPGNKTYKWKDSRALLSYAENHVIRSEAVIPEAPDVAVTFSSKSSRCDTVHTSCISYMSIVTPDTRESDVEFKYNVPANVKAPVHEGEIVGYLEVYRDGLLIDIENVIAAESIQDIKFIDEIERTFSKFKM